MSNPLLKFKFGLKSKLGLIPGTSRLELKDLESRKEYEEFLEYEESKEPQRFLELEEMVNSQDFEDRLKYLKKQRFKDTDEYLKLVEYKSLKNSREFSGYFRIISSPAYDNFVRVENSDELNDFVELEKYVHSDDFKAVKKLKFEDSDAWQKYLKYKSLTKSPEIKDYFKIKHSKDYQAFRALEGSNKLSRFEELQQMVYSSEFIIMKKTLDKADFKATPEYAEYMEYLELRSSPEIKAYQNLQSNKAFDNFRILENSPELEKYLELEKYINSPDFRNARKDFQIKRATELHKLNEYNTLKRSDKFRSYYRLKKSPDMQYYLQLRNSPELEKFQELEEYVNSKEFSNIKAFMESPDKFRKSTEYQQLLEYKKLKISPRLKWYNKLKNSSKFDDLKKWKLVFTDSFDGPRIDRNKWLTSFYWGDQLLNQSYALASDQHFYTEENNYAIENGLLKLFTRKEQVTGQAWDPALGFFPKDFDYTSAVVNTGNSFRQLYGAFEAKVRMRNSPSVFHAFWMLSEKSLPHIDVFRFTGGNKKSVELNNYWLENHGSDRVSGHSFMISGLDFSRGFFIFRLEWYPGKLIWKINNTVVKTQHEGVPSEPMYVLFSSGINENAEGTDLPTSLDIDWVRCFSLEQTGE